MPKFPILSVAVVLFGFGIAEGLAQTVDGAQKDPAATGSAAPDAIGEPLPVPGVSEQDEQGNSGDANMESDDMSIGEIPLVETVELTEEQTKRAVDTYGSVRVKYADAGLENYEDLQEFVDKAELGKAFEADIKQAGFATVNEWNLVVTTASIAYSNIVDDQTEDIKLQIEELQQNSELAQDMKDRMIKSLTAMIPSDNNRKVIEALMADPAYAEKMKSLAVEEE